MEKARHLLHSAIAALALSASTLSTLTSAAAEPPEQPAVREIEIVVDGNYKPSRVEIHEGERVRLKLVRKDYSACTREVVFPALGLRRELPPNQPVHIDLPALAPGEYEYKCGMNMIRGTLVVVGHTSH